MKTTVFFLLILICGVAVFPHISLAQDTRPIMIQGAGTTSERHAYTSTDTTAEPNTVYYYRIEDVSHAGLRKQLTTVRIRGLVSAAGKLTTRWADLKKQKR